MLHCYRCKRRKPESAFYQDNTRNSGYSSKCKVCANEEANLRYQSKRKPRSKSRRKIIQEIRQDGCTICGYKKCDAALEFHHIDPSEKEGNVNDISGPDKLMEEITKCVLLCSNCHREVHMGMHNTDELPRAYVLTQKQLSLI